MSDKKNILILIGAAPCVVDDIKAFLSLRGESCDPWQSCCPAYAGLDWMAIGLDAINLASWPIQYFATYHPSEIEEARERRARAGGNTDYMVIAHQQHAEKATGRGLVDLILPCEPPSGSSALLGVLAGIKMGYEKIIVCGCPLIGTNAAGYDYSYFRIGWEAKLNEIRDKTRAMSGWTRELLGMPDTNWLNNAARSGRSDL
jgi:hypothetical protein